VSCLSCASPASQRAGQRRLGLFGSVSSQNSESVDGPFDSHPQVRACCCCCPSPWSWCTCYAAIQHTC
jgi:hypothetical protein